MNSDTIALFFFLAVAIAFSTYFLIMTLVQQHLSKSILKKFPSEQLQHSSIRYSQTSDSLAIREGLGFPVKADMYYKENLIIICPKKNGLFTSLFTINLPIIITTDKANIEKLNNSHNVFLPDNIKFTRWNDLIINYHDWLFTKIKYELTIEFLNKAEIPNLPSFKTTSS